MNLKQAGLLLVKAQAYDNRTIGEVNIQAWAEALIDIDYDLALDAVAEHYRGSTTWIMPGHIVALVAQQKDRNRDLLHAAGPPDYPSDLTHAQEGEYRKLYQGHVKAGRSRDEATTLADDEFGAQRGHLIAAPDAVRKAINQFTADRTIR